MIESLIFIKNIFNRDVCCTCKLTSEDKREKAEDYLAENVSLKSFFYLTDGA